MDYGIIVPSSRLFWIFIDLSKCLADFIYFIGFFGLSNSSESKFKTSNTSGESSTQDYEDPNVESHSNHRRALKPAEQLRPNPNIPDAEHNKNFFKYFVNEIKNLGKLDGILSSPGNKSNRVRSVDSSKITAILLEQNVIELQRHLITSIVQNQVSCFPITENSRN